MNARSMSYQSSVSVHLSAPDRTCSEDLFAVVVVVFLVLYASGLLISISLCGVFYVLFNTQLSVLGVRSQEHVCRTQRKLGIINDGITRDK